MSDDTQTTSGIPQPPPVISGRELYDSIMGGIEPELLSSNLPNLAQYAQTDTPDQKSERAKRYQAAFEEYDKQFQKNCEDWNESLRTYKRHAIQYIEGQNQTNESDALQSIESSLAA